METGHAKNVANFSKLITACTSFGTDYNPASTKLKLTALQTLYTDSDKAVKKVDAPIANPTTSPSSCGKRPMPI
jgi:hypothetical protein